MKTLIPLSPTQHLTHGWKRHDHYRFAAEDAWAPLLIAELPAALAAYPLAFTARPGGGYRLVALQGLHHGENLMLTPDGRWAVGYIPSHYRGYPFSLREVVEGEQRRGMLCFDHGSGLYRDAPDAAQGEERFFDDQGEPTELVAQLMRFLNQTQINRELTDRAVDALEQAGVLTDWALPVDNPDPERPLLKGLKQIDQQALNALDGAALEGLQKVNALAVAYAQVFSGSRLGVLNKLYALHYPPDAQEERHLHSVPEDLDQLFGGEDDIELDFDR